MGSHFNLFIEQYEIQDFKKSFLYLIATRSVFLLKSWFHLKIENKNSRIF